MAVTWIYGSDTSDPTNMNADYAAAAASWLLYKLTGEKYPGIGTTTEWYGYDGAQCWACGNYDSPAVEHAHMWLSQGSSYSTRLLPLRHGPIISVDRVEVGGSPIPSADYRVVNRRALKRMQGGCWELGQGVEVTYSYGIRPPQMGIIAAKRLADDILLSMDPERECSLPDNIQSVSRQGLDYSMMNPQELAVGGRTGIYEVDLFIATANPSRAKRKAKIFSPHTPNGQNYTY